MSNKFTNGIIAAGTIVMATVAVLQYTNSPDSTKVPADQIAPKDTNVTKQGNAKEQHPIPQSTLEEKTDQLVFVCDDYYQSLKAPIGTLSFSSDKDAAYKKLVPNLLTKECVNEAYSAANELSFSSDRDANYKLIYKKTLDLKEFDFAKEVIGELSFSSDRDEANKQLLESMTKT
ncbi:DUF4476 domain-containing protein [Vibrio genomosp. F6]|uniref:DUF4476 domain-containing protein n=1 Tax=Vibrio genomosp. F6 str. FF-238 TaxID=1191298 RepID=A0A1E5CQN3_9VIBR|nr:DUF4476 domain-containing protein [Vibrio genomosp. F6]OEE72199.1 hypothetical protein A130_07450 [Vibrio genomosp. F6 str. FF-238]